MWTCLDFSSLTDWMSDVCHLRTGFYRNGMGEGFKEWVRGGRQTLSDSLAKNMAPLPIPRVPFFFFPLASTSDTDHVWIESACALFEAAATRSAGSTYVLTGRAGCGGCRGTLDM